MTSRHPLSLHHIMTPELSVPELVEVAARLQCEHVCLFMEVPSNFAFPTVTAETLGKVKRAMRDAGVSLYAATSFPIGEMTDVAAYEPAIERSAALGGTFASVRIDDPDLARAARAFHSFGHMTARHGMTPSIEYMGFDRPDAHRETLAILREAGLGRVTIDPLHIIRTGAPLSRIMETDPNLIGYVQFCDGRLAGASDTYFHESGYDRLPPGEGEFPLLEILGIVPSGRPISLEVPSQPMQQAGLTALERARRSVDGMRGLLEGGDRCKTDR